MTYTINETKKIITLSQGCFYTSENLRELAEKYPGHRFSAGPELKLTVSGIPSAFDTVIVPLEHAADNCPCNPLYGGNGICNCTRHNSVTYSNNI